MHASILRQAIALGLLALSASLYAQPLANETLMLSLTVSSNAVKIDFAVVKAIPFELPANEDVGPYQATLLGKGNKVLYTRRFVDPLTVTVDDSDRTGSSHQGGRKQLPQAQHILLLPQLPEANLIRFSREDETGKLKPLGTEPLPKPAR